MALISQASKVILKILQARLQQYVNRELPDVQAGFRKGRGTRDQIANICWIIEKPTEFQKNISFGFIDYAKAFDCVKMKLLCRPTLCNHMNCSLPGYSIHGIFRTRVLEWVAISFSRGSSWSRYPTWVSCIVGRCFTIWTVLITIKCRKFWKIWKYQTTWPASWKICMQVRKQQLELDMKQQTGSK